MAELILTDEERAKHSWLDLDDATIGKVVKRSALALEAAADKKQRLSFMTCAFMLCNLAHDSNAEHMTLSVSTLLFGDEQRGDWRVTIEKVRP